MLFCNAYHKFKSTYLINFLMFKVISQEKNARVGILEVNNRKAETPFFMPVSTKMTTKLVSIKEVYNIGYKVVICNGFVLYLNPGVNIIKKNNSMHNFMNFNGLIFTDSGGFQMIMNFKNKRNDKGVEFINPLSGDKHFITPEDAVKFQEDLGADCLMCLDDLPKHGTKKEDVTESLRRTHLWAERCKKSHKKGLLFGIIQGSIFNDLRKESAKFIDSLNFDGISIGGLCIGEGKKEMLDMVKICVDNVSREKPLYLMGVGSPEDIIEAVNLGVDIFDSKFPAEIARRESLFTSKGRIDISKKIFKEDFNPIEKNCNCETCKNFSKAYLHHLVKIKEPLAKRLATLHNLQFISDLMNNIRASIKENEFQKFRKEFLKNYKP